MMFMRLIVLASLMASVFSQSTSEPSSEPSSSPSSEPSSSPTPDFCVVIKGVSCLPSWPFNDENGDVCYNEGEPNEAYCNYDYGNNACVMCGLEENCVILNRAWCTENHADGDVCANEGEPDEAYCNSTFGPSACVVCGLDDEDVNEPEYIKDAWEDFEDFVEDGWNEVVNFFENLCFSGNMEVVVKGKGVVPMEALQVGDYVKTGKDEAYEQVYAFGHRVPDRATEFVQLHTNAGSPLEMTSEHLVFVNGKTNPVRAGSIKVGDFLQAEGNSAVVQKIEVVIRNGIYNPLTSSGTILVNGITASNYISFQTENNEYVELPGGIEIPMSHHDFAHRAMAPYRLYCTNLAICDVNDANSGLPAYVSRGMDLIKWSKKQNIAIQLLAWASFRMLLLASILMAGAVFVIPIYMISGKLMHHLQGMVSFESKSVVHFNKKMKKEN